MEHMFYGCPVTSELWTFIGDIFAGICNHRLKPSTELVVYGLVTVNTNRRIKSLMGLLVGMAKYCIWTLRNKLVFNRRPFNGIKVKQFFISTLKSRVLADAYRFSDTKFKQIWCTNNVICSKSGAHVEFEY